ncbi:MAG: methionine--tRNA ligase [Thermoplasmata archaeon]|nr:methionine--tRNA ligase [Thermoplasmata archaeon]MCI4356568.1 methionine--tRNA ligase [Thermoplasmata archaeon]
MARIFVGVAWPYANGPFHLGHLAGAYLPGDIFARFHRLRGDEVLMVSGSDMHGTPTLVTAEKEGTTPEVVANRNDAINRAAFQQLGFSFDLYTNTRTLIHQKTVQELFLALLENGFIARRTEENPFCPKHQRFLPDRYVYGTCPHCGFAEARGDECDNCGRVLEPKQLIEPKCRLCSTPAEFRLSEHFYLLLDKLAPHLTEWLSGKAHFRANVAKVTQNFVDGGLHPTPITRDLEWGVPIPLEGYDAKRFYVWFDAVTGYLSASKEWAIRAGRPEAWRSYWDPVHRARHFYFIGKDNIFFHTLVWPSILLGAGGLQLPFDVPANEWLVIDGKKMAKGRGTVGDASVQSLLAHHTPDKIRFYAALLAPQNHDTELDWEEFDRVHDEILANQYGNLAQRLLVLVRDRYGGRVPPPPDGWTPEDSEVGARLRGAHRRITDELEAVHLKEALEVALTEVREGNRRFHEAKPWASEEPERRRAIVEGLWLLKSAAIWLAPYLPFSSDALFRMLGYPEGPKAGDWDGVLTPVPTGQPLGDVRPLFPKPERKPAPSLAPPTALTSAPGELPPLEIRAARVTEVENHPSADRLYVLTVDAGEARPRTVVAGLRESYTPEQLRGRLVALLANLEPRTIRRITSQGMILAADIEGKAALLEVPSDVEPGRPIFGVPVPAPSIAYSQFEQTPLLVGRVDPTAGSPSEISLGDRNVRAPGSWPPGAAVVVRLGGDGATEGTVLAFDDQHPVAAPAGVRPGTRVK